MQYPPIHRDIKVKQNKTKKTLFFFFILFQKHAKGQELFDQIVYHLDLVETDYFGLQFMDASQVTVSITSVKFYVLQKFALYVINVLSVLFHRQMCRR